jgi:hypothetical protein
MKTVLPAVLVFGMLAATSLATQPTSLKGKVLTATAQPVFGARIQVKLNGRRYKAKTDKAGNFSIVLPSVTGAAKANVIITDKKSNPQTIFSGVCDLQPGENDLSSIPCAVK